MAELEFKCPLCGNNYLRVFYNSVLEALECSCRCCGKEWTEKPLYLREPESQPKSTSQMISPWDCLPDYNVPVLILYEMHHNLLRRTVATLRTCDNCPIWYDNLHIHTVDRYAEYVKVTGTVRGWTPIPWPQEFEGAW